MLFWEFNEDKWQYFVGLTILLVKLYLWELEKLYVPLFFRTVSITDECHTINHSVVHFIYPLLRCMTAYCSIFGVTCKHPPEAQCLTTSIAPVALTNIC